MKLEENWYFKLNDSQTTLRLKKSVQLQDDVHINFNFHRDIQSHEAMALIDKIRSDFNNDLHQAQAIAVRLLGIPTDVWRFP